MPPWLLLKWFGVPRWLFALAALGLVVGGVLLWHSRAVENLRSESYKKGWDDQKARSDAIIRKLDAENAKLVTELKRKTDAQAVRIVVAGERERVLGPGRAAVRCPAVAAAAGGHQPPAQAADAAGDLVPADDRRADVPWGWLVSRATQCDLDRNEVGAWRTWYAEVAKGFAKARSAQ